MWLLKKFLVICFLMLTVDRQISGGPMSDVKLTEANALDGELPEDQLLEAHKPDKDKLAEAVAGALVKGLEDSIEGCQIDPDDREGSIQRCLQGRDATSKAASSSDDVTSSSEDDSRTQASKNDKRILLLKTAFLNLNEEMKNKETLSDADITELLTKIDKVITEGENPTETKSTVVPIPSDSELQDAVANQNYDAIGGEFWNTLFSVSDKVAMGLLLRVKAVTGEQARSNLKTFLEGSDEERLKILAETLQLTKRKIEAKDPDAAVKRSGFVAYDNHGVAVEEPENQVDGSTAEIKRSGFIGSDDHQFTDEELEEQIKRYGFVEPNEAEPDALGSANEYYGLDVRSDVSEESNKLNNFDAKEPLDLEGEELNRRYTQNHEYDEHGVQKKPYEYKSRTDEISEGQNSQAEPEIFQEPSNQQSGIVSHNGHLKTIHEVENPIKRDEINSPHAGQQVNHLGGETRHDYHHYEGHSEADGPEIEHPVAKESDELRRADHHDDGINNLQHERSLYKEGIHAGAIDELGRPIKRSGLDAFGHLGSADNDVFTEANLNHFAAVPEEEPHTEKIKPEGVAPASRKYSPDVHVHLPSTNPLDTDFKNHQHEPHASQKPLPSPQETLAVSEEHLSVIVVASLVVMSILVTLFVNRIRLRRYFNKNVAYRRVD